MNKLIAIFLSIFISITFSYSTIIVGTTGDYAPFSIYNPNTKQFSGKDIDLIQKFAKSKNEKIKIIKTSWKTAEEDLKAGKFQVFVGGMTITPTRQKDFLFSIPSESFSKAAMTTCENLNKYKNLQDIDNTKTLVIENRGGTNEKFALHNLKSAKLLIINDNKKAIASLTKGIDRIKPEIMITDSIEIAYQHSINPKLCQIPVELDHNKSYKAFMFNNTKDDELLLKEFNLWLEQHPEIFKEYKENS